MNGSTVIRTSRGLSIAGTRITIYNVMDYLKADWTPERIRSWLKLTDTQMTDVMNYIEKHREDVESEYRLVLQEADEIRRYWTERNKSRFAEIAALPPKPGQEKIRAKLKAYRAELL